MKKCFVISPIGSDGSPEREHANDVYDYIIKPAMDEAGIESLRSDHLHEPGKISEQMFREIFGSDLCIAVLTGHNPNVFYELAIAQTSGRPVIILIEKNEQLPFDIQDQRSVAYDLKPRNLFENVFVKQLVAHLKHLEKVGWKMDPPFAAYQAEVLSNSDRTPTYYERYSAYGGTNRWMDVLQQSKDRCDLMGLTLDSWKDRKGFHDGLLKIAKSGCQVRMLQMHPDNPMLADYAAGARSHEYVVPNARLTAEYFTNLAEGSSNFEFRLLRKGCPHFRIVLTDQRAFMSPYFYTDIGSPLFCTEIANEPQSAPHQCPLYGQIAKEFEGLWEIADTCK